MIDTGFYLFIKPLLVFTSRHCPYWIHSNDWIKFQVPAVFTELGKTSFSSCAPTTWNNMQNNLKLISFLSFIHLFFCPFNRSFIHSFIHSFVHSFPKLSHEVCSLLQPFFLLTFFKHSFVFLFIHLFLHSFIHSFICLLTRPLIYTFYPKIL